MLPPAHAALCAALCCPHTPTHRRRTRACAPQVQPCSLVCRAARPAGGLPTAYVTNGQCVPDLPPPNTQLSTRNLWAPPLPACLLCRQRVLQATPAQIVSREAGFRSLLQTIMQDVRGGEGEGGRRAALLFPSGLTSAWLTDGCWHPRSLLAWLPALQWDANPDLRPRIERRLQLLWAVRVRRRCRRCCHPCCSLPPTSASRPNARLPVPDQGLAVWHSPSTPLIAAAGFALSACLPPAGECACRASWVVCWRGCAPSLLRRSSSAR